MAFSAGLVLREDVLKTTRIELKLRKVIAAALTLLVTLPVAAAEPLQHWQQKLEQSTFSGTVLVANSDAIIFQQSFGFADRENQRAFDEHTVFDIGSVTKQFTATAIMLLVEQGKLSLSDTIDNFFPNVPADKKNITIHHLLTNSSGLPVNPPRLREYEIVDIDAYIAQVLKLKLVSTPGEAYHYSNIGFSLLAQLIEIASGQDWEAYIRQHILLPAGLTETGYRLLDVQQERLAINYGADQNWFQWLFRIEAASRSVGDPLQHLRENPGRRWGEGSGYLLSTAQDMHAWYLALRSGKILSEASWAQMLHPHIAETPSKIDYYGYGWVISNPPEEFTSIWHDGSNGYSFTTFYYYPDIDLFILTASNDRDNYPYPLMKEMKKSMQQRVANKSMQPAPVGVVSALGGG
ncbi:serine hydrolase domain-containing protein [Alkalimonas delamerensis]|uniref:Serine hydrolase domain-containing protein n=1 Tax=Alkalimonas delamerensis TaxID=265981 RepID=A0ABT9GP73_9GAMM|nr:serine hydrolase domain-containing protein [Alkalimonas delamerensis]MDP4528751.1 serine hydrolase domain-containing protein [Alkalimonas delamerensis]